ncbi:MAG: hypothetical protein ACXV8L_00995 [Ilumatobacteraceae bacterium]
MSVAGPPRDADVVLGELFGHLARILRVEPDDIRVDLDADLLDSESIEVGNHRLDSLGLVELLGILEDDYEVSVEQAMDADGALTIRAILAEAVGPR